MSKPTTRSVEELKSEGLFFTAGAMAFQLGQGRTYGCHYGMRSTLDADRDEFYRGYDAAEAGARR